jgi:cell division protein ZapA
LAWYSSQGAGGKVAEQVGQIKEHFRNSQLMHTLIPITIVIADRTYRVKVQPQDEELVRKTVKTINEKIIEFKTQFAGKDMQDYIAMVLVWFATDQNQGPAAASQLQSDTLTDKLNSMERMLDAHLQAQ